MRVVVVSAAMEEAARWMLEDEGRSGGLEKRLAGEFNSGRAPEVVRAEVTGVPGNLKKEAPSQVRVILQNDASHLWSAEEAARQRKEPLPDPAKVLEFDVKRDIGAELDVTVPWKPGESETTASLRFTYTPPHEERPTTNWPLAQNMKAPRVIVRPWSVTAFCELPPGKPVVLGAQMEAPHEGAVNTGRVWFAVAQLDCGADLAQLRADRLGTMVPEETDLGMWIFSIPNSMAASWLAARKDISGDGATLRAWLDATHDKGGPALSAVMYDGNASGFGTTITSRRHWDDGTGFEPSREPPDIRAIPESDEEYELRHEMESVVVYDPSTLSGGPADPFAPAEPAPPTQTNPLSPPLLGARVTLYLPPHAARWRRLESAMEREAATDPAAMELAAVGTERVTLARNTVHGEVAAVGAWPQGERTRVAFLRCHRSQATARVEARVKEYPESGKATVWIVDTEIMPWLQELTAAGAMDDGGLGTEILACIPKGEGELAAVFLCGVGQAGTQGESRPGEGYFQGYLNTHPHPGGIPYNPRYFETGGPGWTWAVELSDVSDRGLKVGIDVSGPTAPTIWRRWGVKLAHDARRTPETSGVDLPVRFMHGMKTGGVVTWNRPTVLGVMRHRKRGQAYLRWTIARCDAPPGTVAVLPESPVPPLPAGADPFAGNWVQVMLVSVRSDVADALWSDDTGGASAENEKRWLETIEDGKARLLDLASWGMLPNEESTMTTATVTTFVEPRDEKRTRKHPEIPREPLPGTGYSDQIDLLDHVSGIEAELKPTELTLAHDGVFEIVTDSLAGYYEFPEDDDGRPLCVVVNVQRPVFKPHRSTTPWPPKKLYEVVPWNGAPPPEGEKWFFVIRCMTPSPTTPRSK
ncbi:hypothetical protein AYO49_04005 [Verrucomicrobiaceae bacterium SCGC AG-212-N21]|nr:hypothetical protein AYO49_04005 [Verrucomicrobiaceae bacterium SCGC AG-212-N21]